MSEPRIVFCDIDGPIISSGCYGITPQASNARACMNQNAIGYLNILCNHAKARIVTNTSHNYHDVKEPETGKFRNLKTDLIRWGVKEHFFHEDWRTEYPYPEHDPEHGYYDLPRLTAINQWLAKNGDHEWVVFDDAKFTEDKRLVLIDFDHGITRDSIMRACEIFGISHIVAY